MLPPNQGSSGTGRALLDLIALLADPERTKARLKELVDAEGAAAARKLEAEARERAAQQAEERARGTLEAAEREALKSREVTEQAKVAMDNLEKRERENSIAFEKTREHLESLQRDLERRQATFASDRENMDQQLGKHAEQMENAMKEALAVKRQGEALRDKASAELAAIEEKKRKMREAAS